MSILSENLSALARRYPEFKDTLEKQHRQTNAFAIMSARSGMATAKVNGALLHSSYDPLREAERVVATYVNPITTTYIVYGFGLGYYVEALQRQVNDNVDLYVVVDNGDYFLSALAARPFREVFNRLRTHYFLETQAATLVRFAQHVDNDALQVVRIRSMVSVNPPYFSVLDGELEQLAARKRGNKNTTAKFGLAWIKNCARNLPAILRSADCADTAGIAGKVPPVLLVSAGPSLDKMLHQLAAWARKAIVIAIDTACRRLYRAGVKADIIVTTDPQYWNSRHIERISDSQSILLFDPCVHPRALRGAHRKQIVFSTAVPVIRLLSEYIPLQSSIGAGGTVTSIGWEFARWIGAPTVYLIGADFAYPQNAIHCKDCFFEERMAAMGTTLCSYESLYHRYFCASPLERAISYRNQNVVSDRKLAIYATWFGKRIAQYDRPRTITLSDEGRSIPTIRYQDAEQAMATLPERSEDKRNYLQKLAKIATLSDKIPKNAISTLRKRIDKLIETTIDTMRQIERGAEANGAIAASGAGSIEQEIIRAVCAYSAAPPSDRSSLRMEMTERALRKITMSY